MISLMLPEKGQDIRFVKIEASYQITVFKPHKLLNTLVFVYSVVVSNNAFTIRRGLFISWLVSRLVETSEEPHTSTEHCETALASFWIGRVLCWFMVNSQRPEYA